MLKKVAGKLIFNPVRALSKISVNKKSLASGELLGFLMIRLN